IARLDIPGKTDGRAVYGMDVKVPGMLIASIERCPVFGGKVQSFDATAAKAVAGGRHVVQVSNGVAVVATNFWSARQGRRALKVTWDEGALAPLTSAAISKQYEAMSRQAGQCACSEGNAGPALGAGGKVVEAVYQVPFLEHACMEPMNATAHVMPDSVTLWVPTQNPGGHQALAAKLAGVPVERVEVVTTLLGGGFGRRGELDFVTDAVETSKPVHAPVKVIWTPREDIPHGFDRPAAGYRGGVLLRLVRGARGRGLRGARRRRAGAPHRVCDRLRHRGVPEPGALPDGGRGHLRAHGRALRQDHPRQGARAAVQLP